MDLQYWNRSEAGQLLASKLEDLAGRPDVIVLGLPRGGVPVAYEVAHGLGVPLDIFLVRKLGLPGQEELALGAIASGHVRVVNEELVAALGVRSGLVELLAAAAQTELERRERVLRDERPPLRLEGRRVVLVDDGLATGATMRAAVLAISRQDPEQVIVAVPVAAPEVVSEFERLADRVVCPLQPSDLQAVGRWYEDFTQVTDDQVRDLLQRAAAAAERAERPIVE